MTACILQVGYHVLNPDKLHQQVMYTSHRLYELRQTVSIATRQKEDMSRCTNYQAGIPGWTGGNQGALSPLPSVYRVSSCHKE